MYIVQRNNTVRTLGHKQMRDFLVRIKDRTNANKIMKIFYSYAKEIACIFFVWSPKTNWATKVEAMDDSELLFIWLRLESYYWLDHRISCQKVGE